MIKKKLLLKNKYFKIQKIANMFVGWYTCLLGSIKDLKMDGIFSVLIYIYFNESNYLCLKE